MHLFQAIPVYQVYQVSDIKNNIIINWLIDDDNKEEERSFLPVRDILSA